MPRIRRRTCSICASVTYALADEEEFPADCPVGYHTRGLIRDGFAAATGIATKEEEEAMFNDAYDTGMSFVKSCSTNCEPILTCQSRPTSLSNSLSRTFSRSLRLEYPDDESCAMLCCNLQSLPSEFRHRFLVLSLCPLKEDIKLGVFFLHRLHPLDRWTASKLFLQLQDLCFELEEERKNKNIHAHR